ncbi:DNA replication complex GINS family protein [Candidatus Bathyarchaeota archaeon]|nr:DNA replication complex GINS family protein [Candidatus Bathyarchaeota archaeon]
MSERYARLHKAWEKEKENPELQNIPDQFLHEMKQYADELAKTPLEEGTLSGTITKKERQYAAQMVKELTETRLTKIVARELKGEPIDAQAMTPEEQRLHSNIRQLLSGYRQGAEIPAPKTAPQPAQVKPRTAPEPKPTASTPPEAHLDGLVVVRFLQPLPAIMGVDMKAYGPFKAEDVASIPRQNAVNLIRRGIAKLVEIEP